MEVVRATTVQFLKGGVITNRVRNRRSFLKGLGSAGVFLLAGSSAPARSFLVIGGGDHSSIASIEWVPYQTGRQQSDNQPESRCAVRITTASGIQGWADLAGLTMPDHDGARLIRDLVLGRDPGEHDVIWRQLFQQDVSLGALAAVDVALWDLLGRMEEKPVHALIGTHREQAKTCVSTGFNLPDAQKYAEYAVACKEAGIHACKIQPFVGWGGGHGGLTNAGYPDNDMAAYKAVRDAVGPDYPCMADNSCSYTFDEAVRVGRVLDELGYAWYQSPMPEADDWLDRYVALAAQTRTPICAPATHPSTYLDRVSWIAAKACDVACIDVLRGGFTACAEFALACKAAGIPLALPNLGRDAYPHLQLIGVTDPSLIGYAELLSLSRETRVEPGRTTPEPVPNEQGSVAIPQTPGMGVELDWKYIYSHRVH